MALARPLLGGIVTMRCEYGPDVICDETNAIEGTHRPAGGGGPWFCMACGGTAHARLEDNRRRPAPVDDSCGIPGHHHNTPGFCRYCGGPSNLHPETHVGAACVESPRAAPRPVMASLELSPEDVAMLTPFIAQQETRAARSGKAALAVSLAALYEQLHNARRDGERSGTPYGVACTCTGRGWCDVHNAIKIGGRA